VPTGKADGTAVGAMASESGAGFSGSKLGGVVGLLWLLAGGELPLVDADVLDGVLTYVRDQQKI
jgi:hypothetical protein